MNAQAFNAVKKYVDQQEKRGHLDEVYFEENPKKLQGRPTGRCHKNEDPEQKHIKCAAKDANHRVLNTFDL